MSFTSSLSDKKFEIAMFGMAALLLGGLSSLFKAPAAQQSVEQDMVYEMPRPKNFVSAGFDLNGREIDRNYINPFAKKKKDAAVIKAEVKAAQTQAVVAAKKKTAAQKAKEATKNKSQVAVTVVNDKPHSTLSADNSGPGGGAYGGAQNIAAAKTTAADVAAAADEDKSKTSPDQWRALLSAQPNSVNLSKLIAALVKGDVDQKTYNTIVSDLLSSSKADVQALGISAANYSYSVTTFSLVAHKMDSLTGETKNQAQGYLMSYTSATRLNILAAALKSTDTETVVTATEIILQGYALAKTNSSNASAGVRPGRGEVQGSSVANYTQFVAIFKTLAQSGDAAIASMAQTALGQIQTTVASL